MTHDIFLFILDIADSFDVAQYPKSLQKTALDSGLSTTREREERAGTSMGAVESDDRVPHAGPTLQAYLPQP